MMNTAAPPKNAANSNDDVWKYLQVGWLPQGPQSHFFKRRDWCAARHNEMVASGAVTSAAATAALLGLLEAAAPLGLLDDSKLERAYMEKYLPLVASGMSEDDAHTLVCDMAEADSVLRFTSPAWGVLLWAAAAVAAIAIFVLLVVLPHIVCDCSTSDRVVMCVAVAFLVLIMAYKALYHLRERARAHDALAKSLAIFREVTSRPPLPMPPV